jgi:hypothetical protein
MFIEFNVYGMKWTAMEELPDSRKTRGIFDRSLVFKCIAGHVDYNIKDIIRHAGEPKFKPLLAKLTHIHKLLFAYRLVHYNDAISDIRLNIENRNAELTKPLLRLFCSENNVTVAVEEIRLALSKFIAEKNELKSNSLESAMHTTVTELTTFRNLKKIASWKSMSLLMNRFGINSRLLSTEWTSGLSCYTV